MKKILLSPGGAMSTAVYDTFTRADGALGTTEATGPSGEALVPKTWLFSSGIWAVSTNKAVGTPTLGSDLIVNGGFAADTDWTKGSGWTIGAGVASVVSPGDTQITQAVLTVGQWYRADWTVTAYTSGNPYVAGNGDYGVFHNAAGTYFDTFRAAQTGGGIAGQGAGATFSVDNVSIKPLTLAHLFASVNTSLTNFTCDANLTYTRGTLAGIVVSLDSETSPANFVFAYLYGFGGNNECRLGKCVGGTYTNLTNGNVAYAAGRTIRVVKSGTSYSLYYNGAQVGTTQTVSDAGIINNTKHGIFSTYSGNSIDTFYCHA